MKKLLFIISILFFALCSYGQIPSEQNPGEFVVYAEHTDSLHKIYYQLGRYEPKDYTFEINLSGQWEKIKRNPQNNEKFVHVSAPIYLRIQHDETDNYYFLNSYYDVDMFSFPDLPSDNLQIIAGRYAFYIYDIDKQTLSNELIPGLNQYEGEDAISGLYSGLTLFDNEKFLLGNVQGFGVFCFDISNTAKPVDLKQHHTKDQNDGQFYAFFYPKMHKSFDIILAKTDVSSVSPNINRLYKKMGTIKYLAKDIQLSTDSTKQPIYTNKGDDLLLRSGKSDLRINLIDGTIL